LSLTICRHSILLYLYMCELCTQLCLITVFEEWKMRRDGFLWRNTRTARNIIIFSARRNAKKVERMRLIGVPYPAACSQVNSPGRDTCIGITHLISELSATSKTHLAAAAAWRHNSRNYDWHFTLVFSVCNKPTRSTQPCIPPGSLNRLPASAGVRAGMSPLPGGR